MTVTINSWIAWAVAALALFGAVTILYLVSGVLERVGDWWGDRREPLTDEDIAECCDDCGANLVRGEEHRPGCVYLEDLPGPIPLPPERSAVELGFTAPQPAIKRQLHAQGCEFDWEPHIGGCFPTLEDLTARRERWAPAWEAEARGAYQALDLEYPSGLLARVRKNTP